jgi:hypothetical protein
MGTRRSSAEDDVPAVGEVIQGGNGRFVVVAWDAAVAKRDQELSTFAALSPPFTSSFVAPFVSSHSLVRAKAAVAEDDEAVTRIVGLND